MVTFQMHSSGRLCLCSNYVPTRPTNSMLISRSGTLASFPLRKGPEGATSVDSPCPPLPHPGQDTGRCQGSGTQVAQGRSSGGAEPQSVS